MTRDRRMMGTPGAHFTMADHAHRDVDPEHLQMLGKRASALFVEGGVPLTDAVVNVLREERGLNQEHVQRVTEFANNYAFESMFQKEAGDHRVVNFQHGPADTSDVLKEIRTSGGPVEKVASKAQFRRSDRFVPGMDGIRDAFKSRMEKEAAAAPVDYPYENPYQELLSLRDTVQRARDEMLSKLAALNVAYEDSFERLYKEARQVVLSGHSPAAVARTFAELAPSPLFTKLALKRIGQRMEGEDIPAPPLQKVAGGGPVNREHPLCKTFDSFVKIAHEYFTIVAAAEDLSREYETVENTVREKLQ